MTRDARIAAAFARVVSAINTLAGRVGTLTDLTTTDKTSIVNALNELKTSIGSAGAQISDTSTATSSTWSSTKITAQINAAITAIINGAAGDSDTLKELADKIAGLAQADNGLVSATQIQSFTAEQKKQAAENIGMGDPEYDFVPAINAALASGL